MVLHIGTMKSGTSYLQDVLERNRPALAEASVDYLGRGTRAVWDVLDLREWKSATLEGAWARLSRQARRSRHPVTLLSMEMLSTADDAGVRAVVEPFDQVEVIVTVRDLVRTIPSAWQNIVKHGSPMSFADFVAALLDERPSRASDRFWRQHDVGRIVRRWAEVVGPSHVHVVTVPPSGSDPVTLWTRFCEVLDLDPSLFDASADQTSNVSLAFSDTELLRRVNERLTGSLSDEAYNRHVRTFLANQVLRPSPHALPTARRSEVPDVGAVAHAWACGHAERIVSEVEAEGVPVVGSLAELIPTGGPPSQSGPSEHPEIEYPDTVVRVVTQLLRKIAEVDPEIEASRPKAHRRGKRAKDGAADRSGRRRTSGNPT